MATHCPHCGHENPDFSIVCDNCSTQLAEPQAIIQELLDVQALLAQRQQDEMDILRQTMERVQAQLGLLNQEAPTPTEPTPVFEEPTPPEPIQHIQKEEIDHSWVEASLTADDTPLEATPTTTEEPGLAEDTHPVAAFVSRPMVAAPTPPQTEHTPTTSQEPWYKSLPAPLPDGFEVIRKSYQKYKEEGKLPIFFMTLAGGIALLYGIGYLMQYTLKLTGDYSEIIKVGMGFVAAAAALFIGIRLTKRDDQYREYGAMVMSLGIVLNYVMIYFLSDLGNFPTLSSSLVGFGLIVLNTGAGIGLALRFETRLIATLFLLGGAFAPFYLQSTDDGSSYYGYLWLLTAGTCFVAWRIRWRGLYQLAFGISSVLLEANAFLQEPDSGLFVVYYHLFAYLFFALLLVEKRRWKPQLDTYGLVMLSANVALLVINLFTVLDQTLPVLGWVYATNAALFLVAFLLPSREAQAQGRGMLILISGILLGVAIPAFFQQAFMGLFWSLEGLLLLFFGSRFRMGLVRKEGYALLVIAAGKLLWHSQEIVTQWGDTCWHLGLLNLAILLGVITTAWVGGIRTGQNLPSWEGTLLKGLGEVVPLLLSGLLLIISWHTIQEWTYPAAVALIVLLLGWGRWFRTQNTVGWSFVPLLILATGWVVAANEADSFRVSEYPRYGQAVVFCVLLALWGFQLLFARYKHTGHSTYPLAQFFRQVFSLAIPILIPLAFPETASEWIGTHLWLAVLVGYGLYRAKPYASLRVLLVVLALVGTAFIFVPSPVAYATPLAVLGISALIMVAEKAWRESNWNTTTLQPLLHLLPYCIAFSIGELVLLLLQPLNDTMLSAIPQVGWTAASVLWISIMASQRLSFIRHQLPTVLVIGILLAYSSALVSLVDTFIEMPNHTYVRLMIGFSGLFMGVWTYLFVNRGPWYTPEKPQRWNRHMVGYQLLWVPVYLTAFSIVGNITGALWSFFMVAQGIVLLFLALRRKSVLLNRTAVFFFGVSLLKIVFWDTRSFATVQKVLVLIGIGVLLLIGAFLFVRLRKRMEEAPTEETVARKEP